MSDEEEMALCAIRYTIGRRSYVVPDGVRWAMRFGTASREVREIIIRDLEAEIDRQQATGMRTLGSDIDEQLWRSTLKQLRELP